MMEFFYVLFLLSGLLKSILYSVNINLSIDFTLLTALVAILFLTFGAKIKFERKDLLTQSSLLIFFIWILITLTYSESKNYSIIKSVLFGTNLVAFYVPFAAKKFDTDKFFKYFINTILFLAIFYYFFNADVGLRFFSIKHFKYKPLEGMGLGLAEVIGAVILLLLFYEKIKGRIIYLFVFIWILGTTGARAPIILLLSIVVVIICYYIIINLKKGKEINLKYAFWKLNDLFKVREYATRIIIINALFIVFLMSSNYVQKMYERTFWRLGLLYNYDAEENKEDVEEVFKIANVDSVNQKAIKPKFNFGLFGSQNKTRGINNETSNMEAKGNINYSVNARVKHYQFSMSAITYSVNRFVFGYGIGSYNMIKNGIEGRNYPHNVFLEVMVELGFIGLMLYLLILILFARNITAINIGITLAVLFLLLNSLKSSSIIDLRVFFSFLAIKHILFRKKIIYIEKE